MWNIDFDTKGFDQNGDRILFDSNTIFSNDRHGNNWQRYDGQTNTGNSGNIASDNGIPGSNNVAVTIKAWNGGSGYNTFAVGFDSSLSPTFDGDLQQDFKNPTPTQLNNSPRLSTDALNGYRNVLIIQSNDSNKLRHCGGEYGTSTHKQVLNTGVCSNPGDLNDTPGPKDNIKDYANDERSGGDIKFVFEEEVTLFKMNIFDIEEDGGKVKFYDEDGQLVEMIDIPEVGDNGVGLLTFNGDIGIKASKMLVWLAGSGAIDNIMGDTPTTSIPEPGTMALFGIGLGAMGFYRRRRFRDAR